MAPQIKPYLMYYPCCSVQAMTRLDSKCWFCGEGKGWKYYDAFEELPFEKQPVRTASSQSIGGFSGIMKEFLRRPHP